MRNRTLLAATAMAGSLACASAAHAQSAAKDADTDAPEAKSSEIVVTGVFSAKSIEQAPISVSVVTSKELEQRIAVSAADLLKNVPGVYVNSGLGEIRNVVFSRGVSANSLDGAGGYYYVSMQEDGLPVDLITAGNYGPDYFLRADITTARLEGLRGGTAAITGPNAPGGIFNYISKNGKTAPGVQVQAKFGLEGNVKAPYYRLDAFAGGQLANNLYYSVGGFVRVSRGSHDPGYDTNRGGQIKANLLYEYATGSVLLTAKYLDDRNSWNEFTPSLGGTRIAPGFSNTSSDLQPRAGAHCFPEPNGSTSCWDPGNLVHSRSLALGMTLKQDLSDTIHFENRARFSRNTTHWNSGAVISVVPATDAITNINLGSAFTAPGTLNYYFQNTGTLALRMTTNGNAFAPNNFTVLVNNLPNQNILPAADGLVPGVYTGFADVDDFRSSQFVDQAQLTAKVGNHTFALGGYAALAKLTDNPHGAGAGLMTLTNQPQMLTVTLTDASGKVFAVTDPTGFGGYGARNFTPDYRGTQHQFAVFAGDTWEATDRLSLEAGGRWESIHYDVTNQRYQDASAAYQSAGGADRNPLTLYDTNIMVPGASFRTKRDYSYFNYSVSAAYKFAEAFNAYVRWTDGRKAPDFGGVQGIAPGNINLQFDPAQRIQQLEMGLKFNQGGVDIQVFPFYSKLSNVGGSAIFQYTSGSLVGQFYTTAPVRGVIKTIGAEIASNFRLSSQLSLHANLTLQDPKASNFGSWTQGPKGNGTDDKLTLLPEGDADNNPKIILRAGGEFKPTDGTALFAEVSHIGKRAANAAGAFYLPAYTTVDVGASVQLTDAIKLQANVNNLFNEVGIVSWSRTGFLASLDRQGLTKATYNPHSILPVVPIQARSVFFTLSGKF